MSEELTPFERQVLEEFVMAIVRMDRGSAITMLFFVPEKLLDAWGSEKLCAMHNLARKGYLAEFPIGYSVKIKALELLGLIESEDQEEASASEETNQPPAA